MLAGRTNALREEKQFIAEALRVYSRNHHLCEETSGRRKLDLIARPKGLLQSCSRIA